MIAHLAGDVVEKREGAVVLDVNGVGYLVHVSQTCLATLPPGERVRLRTYTHVREDALDLFGFATEEEEAVFRELLGVKNVGPRAALNILSGIEPREFAAAVATGDVARLTKVPGIGKKTAERLVVELRDRLEAVPGPARDGGVLPRSELWSDAFAALTRLGYTAAQAQDAVRRASAADDDDPSLETLVRRALALLARPAAGKERR